MGEQRTAFRRLLPRRAGLLGAVLLVMSGCGGGGAALPAQEAVAQAGWAASPPATAWLSAWGEDVSPVGMAAWTWAAWT